DRGRPAPARRSSRARHRPRPRRRRPPRSRLRRPDEGRELLGPDLWASVRLGGAAVRAVSKAASGDPGVFDAHHHLWDTRVLTYRLFREVSDLDRPFLLSDYEEEARRLGVTGSIWVEAASAGADGARELEWVRGQVAASALVEGLVAYVALEQVDGALERLFEASGPPVVGVRRSFEFEESGVAGRPEVVPGARLAGESGLVVDLVFFPPALPAVLDLVDACPATQFVLDHLGKPEIVRRGWEPWASHLRSLSERSNLVAKLSGLTTEADHAVW